MSRTSHRLQSSAMVVEQCIVQLTAPRRMKLTSWPPIYGPPRDLSSRAQLVMSMTRESWCSTAPGQPLSPQSRCRLPTSGDARQRHASTRPSGHHQPSSLGLHRVPPFMAWHETNKFIPTPGTPHLTIQLAASSLTTTGFSMLLNKVV